MLGLYALLFLVAAMATSFLGRVLLINAAFGVSTPWGFTVLFAPFGPLIFRYKYPELAYPTRYWRMATLPLMLLFFATGGSSLSFRSLENFGHPSNVVASAGNTNFHLPVPQKVVTAALASAAHTEPAAEAAPAPVPSAAAAAGKGKPAPTAVTAAATPSKAVAASLATMVPAPKIFSPAERAESNRREFAHLAEWYDTLKHERGYLQKNDLAAIAAYNEQAAQYQNALHLAKTEQAELAKLTATK